MFLIWYRRRLAILVELARSAFTRQLLSFLVKLVSCLDAIGLVLRLTGAPFPLDHALPSSPGHNPPPSRHSPLRLCPSGASMGFPRPWGEPGEGSSVLSNQCALMME